MKKYLKKILQGPDNTVHETPPHAPHWKNILLSDSPFVKSESERAAMTIKCRDTDSIKKVKDAGQLRQVGGSEVQIMHNGLKVLAGGYYGDWMIDIIKKLRGHHEPQEEFAFHEVLQHIDPEKPQYMIELGSFWSYYSLWFAKHNAKNFNICCEPDPNNIMVGKKNVELNKLKNFTFVQSAAGCEDGQVIALEMDSDRGKTVEVPIRSVDSLVAEYDLPKLDILHMDVQGYETDSLEGALETIKAGKLRFLFVSTHHYSFSGDPRTHSKCLEFIKENGGHIISQHNVLESFSGDGLIVASFDKKDRELSIHTSINSSQDSLFRPYEEDLGRMIEGYEGLRSMRDQKTT